MEASGRVTLAGQVAIVTGAGSGLGRAEALELARRGAAVVVNDVGADRADAVATEIEAAGGSAVSSHDSVATPSGGAAIVDQAIDAFGTISIVVNNAGVLRPGFFDELTFDRVDEILDVHLKGAFYVTQPAWRVMKAAGYGRVVMTSSSAGLFSNPMAANYAAAKAGIYGLTKTLAYEGAPFGIRVNAILPYAETSIRTSDAPEPMQRYAETMAAEGAKFGSIAEPGKHADRWDPALTASLVSYLASNGCDVTGEAFSVCLGRYARVFVGVAEGWLPPDARSVSAESIVDHLDEIRDISTATVPTWLFEEVAEVEARIERL